MIILSLFCLGLVVYTAVWVNGYDNELKFPLFYFWMPKTW